MAKCVWALLLMCVCSVRAQEIADEMPMSTAARGTSLNRFQQSQADEIKGVLPIPQPFEQRTRTVARPSQGNAIVSAATLKHKVPKPAQKAYERGVKALQKGEIKRALEQLQAAVKLDDEYAFAHSNLGVAYVRQERLTEAEKEIRRAIVLDPYLPMAHSNLAWVLARAGRTTEAVEMAKRAVEIDPNNQPARKLLSSLTTN